MVLRNSDFGSAVAAPTPSPRPAAPAEEGERLPLECPLDRSMNRFTISVVHAWTPLLIKLGALPDDLVQHLVFVLKAVGFAADTVRKIILDAARRSDVVALQNMDSLADLVDESLASRRFFDARHLISAAGPFCKALTGIEGMGAKALLKGLEDLERKNDAGLASLDEVDEYVRYITEEDSPASNMMVRMSPGAGKTFALLKVAGRRSRGAGRRNHNELMILKSKCPQKWPARRKHILARKAFQASQQQFRTGFLVFSYEQAAELYKTLRADDIPVQVLCGPAAKDVNGRPLCTQGEAMGDIAGSWDHKKALCRRCPNIARCMIRIGAYGNRHAAIRIAPYQFADAMAGWLGDDGLLVIEESPPLWVDIGFTLEELRQGPELAHDLLGRGDHQKAIELAFKELTDALAEATDDAWPRRFNKDCGFARAHGLVEINLGLQTPDCSPADDRQKAARLGKMLRWLRLAAQDDSLWLYREVRSDGSTALIIAGPDPAIVPALRSASCRKILSNASGHPEEMKKILGQTVEVVDLRLPDLARVDRLWLSTDAATQKTLLTISSQVRHEHLIHPLEQALDCARRWPGQEGGARDVLLVAHMPVAQYLLRLMDPDTAPSSDGEARIHSVLDRWCNQEGRRLQITHYRGPLRGQNRWSECDGVICLGDPRKNLEAHRRYAARLELDVETSYRLDASDELEQALNRSRPVRREGQPILHVVVGSILPTGWTRETNIHVMPLLQGRPVEPKGTLTGARLRQIRTELGMTQNDFRQAFQEEFGESIGERTLCRYENSMEPLERRFSEAATILHKKRMKSSSGTN